MVFGNLGDSSGTGVCFTRNPATGASGLYGEYLVNAQGEDVVAGLRTPKPIAQLEADLPQAYAALLRNCATLEREFQEMMVRAAS
jgi:pyruvate, orthophosphate dikinase